MILEINIACLFIVIVATVTLQPVQAIPNTVDPSSVCYPPKSFNHGEVSPLQEYYHTGYAIDFKCNDGYELVGETWTVCIYNTTARVAHWHFDIPVCIRKISRCDALYPPDHGSLYTTNGYTVGSIAKYSCNDGFKIVGVASRLCQNNGQWESLAPVCEPLRCQPLNTPNFGSVYISGYTPGSIANYSCNEGYTLVGSTTRECTEDCQWSGSEPTCIHELLRCPSLFSPSNGSVQASGNTPGSVATYSCNANFVLVGSSSQVCQENGKWNGTTPQCLICSCPTLENPMFGYVHIRGDNAPGSRAEYRCNEGFILVGERYRNCLSQCQWSRTAPTCMPLKCPDLGNPNNGSVQLIGNTPGSKAKYQCDMGFILIGLQVRHCQSNGQWDGQEPTCSPCRCPQLENLEYGTIQTSGNTPGSTAHYDCDDGFRLVGSSSRNCTFQCKWTETTPTCMPLKCPDLENPNNGSVQHFGNTPGSRAEYQCDMGFILIGPQVRYCQLNGQWDGQEPTCSPCRCPQVENLEYGTIQTSGNTPGSTTFYICNNGFKLIGTRQRNCTSTCQWTGDAPICKLIQCSFLEILNNGNVYFNGITPGSIAEYQCNEGFVLDGEQLRHCQPNGQWTGHEPQCLACVCPILEAPTSGSVHANGYTAMSTAYYTCNDGFKLVGNTQRNCSKSCQWTGTTPKCIQITCPTLESPAYGSVISTGNMPGSTATYSCNTGFILNGHSTVKCQTNGQWSKVPPTCLPCRCSQLYVPTNGNIHVTSYTPGSRADYSCRNGYKLDGVAYRICQDDCQWNGKMPSCNPPRCRKVDSPRYGSVLITGYLTGSSAHYVCNDGFKLVGAEWRTCQQNGQWSGSESTCIPLTCPTLDTLKHGSIHVTGLTVGSVARYQCNNGFRLVGVAQRRCQYDEQWTGTQPKCKLVTCPSLDSPRNGSIYINGNTLGAKANFSCKPGFLLVGSTSLQCLSNGKWSSDLPKCIIIRCPNLDHPRNGSLVVSGNTPGSKIVYSCNNGFKLSGERTLLCLPEGQWNHSPPVCLLIQCPNLDPPGNGSVLLKGRTPTSVADYSCNRGFKIIGETRRVCKENGQWSGMPPSCVALVCPQLHGPRNGSVLVSGNTPGAIAHYSCNNGFSLVGDKLRTCQDNEKWTGIAPFCKFTRCLNLDHPAYGSVTFSGTIPGSHADYVCDQGFKLVGVTRRVCQLNGKWSESAPICKVIQCPRLSIPKHGSVRYHGGTAVGSVAIYDCKPGFFLTASLIRVCEANGQWNGIASSCQEVQCPSLPNPLYGSVSVSGHTPGSVADYKCNNGFSLVGATRRKCQTNGKWSLKEPICQLTRCPQIHIPDFVSVQVTGYTPGSTVHYTCSEGYKLIGPTQRVCNNNGQWNGIDPSCERIVCPNLENPSNGNVNISGNMPGSTASYSCNNGHKLVGDTTRMCQENEKWSGVAPICQYVRCSNLLSPRSGTVQFRDTSLGSTAQYRCNNGFKLIGAETRQCQDNGYWSGVAPICHVVTCPRPSEPRNGRVVINGHSMGSSADYYCFDGYTLVGVAWRKCQNNGQWSGSEPQCRAVDCGALRSPNYGNVNVHSTLFGSRAQYSCQRGFTLTGGSYERMCQSNGYWSGVAPYCRRLYWR